MPVGIGWIIRARGLAPSIGAGGTIVAAGLCALLFVSALLTFRAWPDGDGPRAGGALSLRVPELKASGRAATPRPAAAVTRAAAPAPARPSRGERATRPRATTPRAAYRAPAPVTAAPATPAPVASRPATTARPVTKTAPAPAPGPVESTVAAGRQTVEHAAPPVVAPAAPVLDTVQQTAHTVDGIVKPLLP